MIYVILRLMCTKVYESWRGGILTRCCIGCLSPIPAGPFSFPSWLSPLLLPRWERWKMWGYSSWTADKRRWNVTLANWNCESSSV